MSDQLKIQFRANAPDENLTLDDFCEQMVDFNAALTGIDQHLSARNKSTVVYRVVDLIHSSPAAAVLDAIGREDSLADNSMKVFPAFVRTVEGLNAGRGYQNLPRNVLEPIHRIAKALANGVKEIKIIHVASGESVFVTDRISSVLGDFLETEKISVGSVRGTIDRINVHAGANKFRIYPIIGASFVDCLFPSELKEKAKSAIEQYVCVSGKLHYRVGCEHPYQIDVDEIETMPDESTLPALASFKGIIKTDKSTEELLDEERNGEW
jgi:hypothetical protein